jgi:hypothetical protein
VTAGILVPEQPTVVLLGGAVLLQAAIAAGVKALDSSTTPPTPIPNALFKGIAPFFRNTAYTQWTDL